MKNVMRGPLWISIFIVRGCALAANKDRQSSSLRLRSQVSRTVERQQSHLNLNAANLEDHNSFSGITGISPELSLLLDSRVSDDKTEQQSAEKPGPGDVTDPAASAEKETGKQLQKGGKAIAEKAEDKPVKAKPKGKAVEQAKNAAALTGVQPNKHGDLATTFTTWTINATLVLVMVTIFAGLRKSFHLVYCAEAEEEMRSGSKFPLPDTFLGWIPAGWNVPVETMAEHEGLDSALIVEYCDVCIKILSTIGAPMVLVMCPVHYLFGGDAAKDELSSLAMSNVILHHPWMYYAHGMITCLVTITIIHVLYNSMEKFLKLRYAWLRKLPAPRCTTVLVEGIPPEFCSDEKLIEFFEVIYPGRGREVIKECNMVKDAPKLLALFEEEQTNRAALEAAKDAWEDAERKPEERPTLRDPMCIGEEKDAIEYYEEKLKTVNEELQAERDSAIEAAKTVGGINTNSAFVTFTSRREAAVCLELVLSERLDEWMTCAAPPHSAVRYNNLKTTKNEKMAYAAVAQFLICVLYIIYVPLVCMGTNLANVVDVGYFQPIWDSFAPGLSLMIFLAFLPTVFLAIFHSWCHLISDTFAQHKLQIWYTYFMVFFVLLVTCIGQSLIATFGEIIRKPEQAFVIMAEHMPRVTHFYMDFVMLQWWGQAKALIRPAQIGKYTLFRYCPGLKYSENDAKMMSEPEDQDFDGIGARTSRLTIILMIGLVFSTLSPLIAVMCLIFFVITRVTFGYLIVYAETKKPDLGGVFFRTQLSHVLFGLLLYNILMVGVLAFRARTRAPMSIATLALFYTIYSINHFEHNFLWETLPFREVCKVSKNEMKDKGTHYIQPEFLEETVAQSSFSENWANRNTDVD